MVAIGSALFFLSGFTALVYQVVWQRLLGLFSGADVYAATIIVGAFMGGLGCGSLAGGHLADRLSRRGNLLAFAAAELAVGLFGLLSAPLYYDILYLRFGHLATPTLVPLVLFLSLLWPTFFMGMSLPLLARALTRTIERAAPTIGVLYGLNALGASAGALLTTWWLLPSLGLDGSLRVSALLNIGVALAAAVLTLRVDSADLRSVPNTRASQSVEPVTETDGLSFPSWLAIYMLSGFLALSLEIAWFRAIGVIAKATAFTFGTLLAVYLGGLGLGSSVGSVFAGRVRRPAMAFLLVQTAIGIYVGLSLILLLSNLDTPALAWLQRYLGQYDPLDLSRSLLEGRPELLMLYLGIPVALIGPPTLLMGISFPLLQKVAQTDFDRLGSRVGTLMLANIVGSTLGAILTGWWGLRYLGTAGTLKAAVATCGVFGLIGLRLSFREPTRRWASALTCTTAVLVAGTLVAAMPATRKLWAGLHSISTTRILFNEDETGLSLVKLPSTTFDDGAEVFVNGLGQSWLPYGDIHTALGALPAFLHPDPRDAAVIGLGSGDTVFGLAGRREIARITCIEIVRSQLDTLVRFGQLYGYPGLKRVLGDSRIEHVNGDGRLYAMRAGRQFDIIEADALRPGSAYAGNLYSDRYFMLLRDRLKPGGLAVTWAPTPRIRRTFLKVFPHVVVYGDILIGSGNPIDSNPDAIRARLSDPRVIDYYAGAAVDIRRLVEGYIGQWPLKFDASHDRSTIVDINTDLFPRDEFELPPPSAWRSRRAPTD
jgi:predicted membrane-bound spermidine synthase